DVDDEQEERRRRQQRENDRREALYRPGSIDRRRLEQRLRYRLKAGEEEQEVVADLFPDRRDDDHDQRVRSVQQRIPGDAPAVHPVREDAERRIEQEQPQDGG